MNDYDDASTPVTDRPRGRTVLKHSDWMAAAAEEYRRLLDLLEQLDDADWTRGTDCTEWDVRQLVAHLVGAANATADIREARRQQKLGRELRPEAPVVDGINELHVRERADAAPSRLVADLAEASERGLRARKRIPAVVRAVRVPFGPPLGVRSIGYLMDRIYTRDVWMHRIDIARATGRSQVLTSDHDGRLVADVVEEWARKHRRPYSLALTGPAGGQWSRGPGGEEIEMDAIEFCRVLSGRGPGQGLLASAIPF